MKKALAITLALVLVLSLCGSAFAANDNLVMTYSTEIVHGERVNTFQYRNAAGKLVREEVETLGDNGQLIEKNVAFYNEEGQKTSERIASLENNGVWKDDEAVWTYHSDGSQVIDSRTVYTMPDMSQKFERLQVIVDADGKSSGRGECRDARGYKLYDLSVAYEVSDDESVDEVKYTYPNGSVSTEYSRKRTDGTVINETIDENAAGQIVREKSYQQAPDGSYTNQSVSYRYQANGKRFVTESLDTMDKDGYRETERSSYTLDEDGFGSGRGVYTDGTGQRAIMEIEYRDDGAEGTVCATAYRFGGGRVDLKTVSKASDGTITTAYESFVKNYDGGDDEEDVDAALLAEDEEDSFDAWDEVFGDWSELSDEAAAPDNDDEHIYYETEIDFEGVSDNQYEDFYTGDPTALDSDGDINYYESEVDWGSVSDWGWDSSWDGGWDDASDWE